MAHTLRLLTAFLAVAALAGCGASTYPVHGKVTFEDGSPLPGGQVIFSDAESHFSAIGEVQPNGTFVLGSYAADDGAPAGTYQVAVSPAGDENPPTIDPRFLDPQTSGIEYTVESGNNTFHVKVARPKVARPQS